MSEDATSQVASTCLQIEYDCIVVLLFFFFFFWLGGVSSDVPDPMNRVSVWMLCNRRCETRGGGGVFFGGRGS